MITADRDPVNYLDEKNEWIEWNSHAVQSVLLGRWSYWNLPRVVWGSPLCCGSHSGGAQLRKQLLIWGEGTRALQQQHLLAFVWLHSHNQSVIWHHSIFPVMSGQYSFDMIFIILSQTMEKSFHSAECFDTTCVKGCFSIKRMTQTM